MIPLLLGLSLALQPGGVREDSAGERHAALVAAHRKAVLLGTAYDLDVVRLEDDGSETVVNQARGVLQLARPAAGTALVKVRRDGAGLIALELFGDGRNWYTVDRARRKYTRAEPTLEGQKWTPQLTLFRAWSGAPLEQPTSISSGDRPPEEGGYAVTIQYHDFEETYRVDAERRLVTASRAFRIVNAQGITHARYDYRFDHWKLGTGVDTTTLLATAPTGFEEIDANWSRTKRLVPLGQPLPDMRLVFLDGRTARLFELRGKTVVLAFWFIDCAPCRKELPELSELASRYTDRDDLVFVCVNGTDKREAIEDFWRAKELVPEPAMALGSDLEKCRVSAYPSLYVLDPTGLVTLRATGFDPETSMEKLERAIEAGPR